MKKILLIISCFYSWTGFAQSNYVATSPIATTPGSDNTLVGVGAGNLNMSGASNLFIGRAAGTQNMAGTQNVFLGASSGNQNTSGQANAFIGYSAGFNNSSGNSNTFLGASAGFTNTSGFNNTFSGYRAGFFNNGNNNAFIGSGAGYANSQGNNNTFLGADAGSNNTVGSNNTYIGTLSGTSSGTTVQNTFVGANTGVSNLGVSNTFIGFQAGQNNQTGGYNVFIGASAGASNTSGLGNLFMGQQSGANNSTGSYNLFMGNSSGSSTQNGQGNTAIGDGAMLKNTAGTHNVAIGRYAGVESRNDENTFIGFAADVTPSTPNLTNAMALGARARVSQSNSIVLGDPTNGNVNLGLGTTAPTNKLHIVSAAANSSGLRLQNLTAASPASALNQQKFLTVDGSGNVVLGSINNSARMATESGVSAESYWQLAGGRLTNSSGEAVVIGKGIQKLGGSYGLYVEKGILTEKVKVAVKNSADWSDYVFAPSYRLRKLSEVEAFIKAHGHLPGVPSADQVVSEGLDMAKMDATLLQKIEELTLYMVEMKKEVNSLRKENEQLRRRNSTIERQVKQIRNASK